MEGHSHGMAKCICSVNPSTPMEQDCRVVDITSGDVIVISYGWCYSPRGQGIGRSGQVLADHFSALLGIYYWYVAVGLVGRETGDRGP